MSGDRRSERRQICKVVMLDIFEHLWYGVFVEMDLSILHACFGGTSREGCAAFLLEQARGRKRLPDVCGSVKHELRNVWENA